MDLGIHHLERRLYYELFITPRVTPLYYHYSNEPSICDAFGNSHVQYISGILHIIRSVFKPHFIHYTKYAKYAFLLLFSIYVLTLNKHPSEASIMVARQLKIVSQIDAFTISATRKMQYVFKKLVCLIVFVKDRFDVHLNNIYSASMKSYQYRNFNISENI